MISHMSQKMLTKKKILSPKSVKAMCFTTSKDIQGSLLMVTRSSPLPTLIPTAVSSQLTEFVVQRRPLAICSTRGSTQFTEKFSCFPLHMEAHKHTCEYTHEAKSGHWSSRLLPAADIVYTCRLKKQHSDAALRWHPGQNGIIKLN